MANKLESDIIRVLTETRDVIRANMEARKINASGRTSDSLRVESYDGGVRLIGGYNTTRTVNGYTVGTTAPIPTLEVGREGGRVPKGFYYIIREWTFDKGLNFGTERERNTFAYFLARKIARTGTIRNTSHVDIYSTPVTDAKARINGIIQQSVSRTIRAAIGGKTVSSLKGAFTE